jgi:hypothetical protein
VVIGYSYDCRRNCAGFARGPANRFEDVAIDVSKLVKDHLTALSPPTISCAPSDLVLNPVDRVAGHMGGEATGAPKSPRAGSEEIQMSALYAMRYVGGGGAGAGAIYIGRGTILGIDVTGGRFQGTYTEQAGRMRASITMSVPAGTTLVTGQIVSHATNFLLTADWPLNFAGGNQQIMVAGRPVQVTFEKIGDIP